MLYNVLEITSKNSGVLFLGIFLTFIQGLILPKVYKLSCSSKKKRIQSIVDEINPQGYNIGKQLFLGSELNKSVKQVTELTVVYLGQ